MKNYFLCLCIFAKLWLKQKALSAFKTLYIHLYFSIYIFKDLILPKKTNTRSKTFRVNFNGKSMVIEEAKSKQSAKTATGNPHKLEPTITPIQLTSVFRKSRLEKKSKSTQQQQPNQTVITQQPQKPTQNISKITN